MKVRVIKEFRDKENDMRPRKKNEQMDVTAQRAAKLLSLGLVEEISEKEKGKAAAE